ARRGRHRADVGCCDEIQIVPMAASARRRTGMLRPPRRAPDCRYQLQPRSVVPGLLVLQASADAEKARAWGLRLLGPYSLLREFLRQLDPLSLRRELLVGAPVRARVRRQSHLFQRHREIEMRVGVKGVEA